MPITISRPAIGPLADGPDRSPLHLNLLSPKEAGAYARKSTSSLAKLRVYGGGPVFIKNGRRVYYDVADLDAWLASRRRRSTSDTGK